jgi:hypothetical protein
MHLYPIYLFKESLTVSERGKQKECKENIFELSYSTSDPALSKKKKAV